MKTKIKNVRRPIDVIDIAILALMTASLVFLSVVVFMVCKPIEVKASSIEVYYFDVEEKEAVDLDSQIVLEVEQKLINNSLLEAGVADVLSEENIEVYPVESEVESKTRNSEYLYDITEEELLLFKQVMAAEGDTDWTYDEMLSLVSVAMNRMDSNLGYFQFDSFYEMLTSPKQWSAYHDGRYKTKPISEACEQAVEDGLKGKRNLDSNIMYVCTEEYYTNNCTEIDFFKKDLDAHVYQVHNVLFFVDPKAL